MIGLGLGVQASITTRSTRAAKKHTESADRTTGEPHLILLITTLQMLQGRELILSSHAHCPKIHAFAAHMHTYFLSKAAVMRRSLAVHAASNHV